MEIERRERDPDTGEIVGEGFGDVFAKIAANVTGKTAKKLATKAAEKLIEKGAEKVGEKTGQLVGEKIYDRFSTKPSELESLGRSRKPQQETKGKEIGEMLKAVSSPPAGPFGPGSFAPEKNKFQKISNVYEELL